MPDQRFAEEPAVSKRIRSSLLHWICCGAVAGVLCGAAQGGLVCALNGNDSLLLEVVIVAAVIGAVVGALFACIRWAGKPKECSLCSWIAFILGLFGTLLFCAGIGG